MDGAYTGIGTVGFIAIQGGIYTYGLGWLKRGGQRRDEKCCNYNDDRSEGDIHLVGTLCIRDRSEGDSHLVGTLCIRDRIRIRKRIRLFISRI